MALAVAALGTANLLRPYWTRTRSSVRAATNFAIAVLLAIDYRAQPLIDVNFSSSFLSTRQASDARHFVDLKMSSIVLGAIAISLLPLERVSCPFWRAV